MNKIEREIKRAKKCSIRRRVFKDIVGFAMIAMCMLYVHYLAIEMTNIWEFIVTTKYQGNRLLLMGNMSIVTLVFSVVLALINGFIRKLQAIDIEVKKKDRERLARIKAKYKDEVDETGLTGEFS